MDGIRSAKKSPFHALEPVISDAREGVSSALDQVFTGSSWQCCKVHSLRDLSSAVPKLGAPAVSNVVKSIFLQPTPGTAGRSLKGGPSQWARPCPSQWARPCPSRAGDASLGCG
jgi:transposase-like protein